MQEIIGIRREEMVKAIELIEKALRNNEVSNNAITDITKGLNILKEEAIEIEDYLKNFIF